MKKLEQAQQPLYAIAVPGDSMDYCIVSKGAEFSNELGYILKGDAEFYDLGTKEKFKIVGTATKDHIDFDVTEYIDIDDDQLIHKYRVYDNRGQRTNFKEYSFRSLLTANELYFENPLGEEPQEPKQKTMGMICTHRTKLEKWQQAQQKVVEKLVFIKPV